MEEENPLTVEDALVIAYRSIEQQAAFRYEDDGDRGKIFQLEPELKWGAFKNGQVELRAPFFVGPGDREGSGNLSLELVYGFNIETPLIPATAVRVGVDLPSGEDAAGVDSTVIGIVTKGVARARFHVNAGFTNVGDPDEAEHDFRYRVVLAADHPADFGVLPIAVGLDSLIVADIVVERAPSRGRHPLWTAELGVRHQINPWTLVTLGAGAGLSSAAADFLLVFGYQYTFAAF